MLHKLRVTAAQHQRLNEYTLVTLATTCINFKLVSCSSPLDVLAHHAVGLAFINDIHKTSREVALDHIVALMPWPARATRW